jgi:DMSO/TMAO reductase YedYZ molybdopterin-dependent catalytic subunit
MAEPVDRLLDQLPIHPDVAAENEWQGLRVDGLVAAPFTLSRDDLTDAGQGKLTDDFRCTDGWVVPGLRWEGVPVTVLLDRAGPLPEAAYVVFSAGEYTVGLAVEQARSTNVIVALRLNEEALPTEHGGPCRLVAQGQLCHFSVKWLDRIRLMADPPEETGLKIVTARKAQSFQS